MAPLRVLVVHNRYRSGQPSGEDNVVDQEVALLREAGHDVATFERRSDDIADMSLARKALVPLTVPWSPSSKAAMATTLAAFQPDVVHLHNTFPLISASVLAACTAARVPVVATLHNYTQVCPSGTLYRNGATCTECVGKLPIPALRHGCYRNSTLATVPLALNLKANQQRWWSSVSRFLCISAAQRTTLTANGMPADLLSVKYNFVADTPHRRTGQGDHYLYLGRLTEEKGVRLLMSAWRDAPLVVAGAGPLADEVAAWAATRPNVSFVGMQTSTQSRELVANAIAVVVPSMWQETFGLVVVEAMAAGVPAVVAGHGSLTELVTEGKTGTHFPPGDADGLTRALARITPEMGGAARARYERDFTPKAGLANLEAVYHEVALRDTDRVTH